MSLLRRILGKQATESRPVVTEGRKPGPTRPIFVVGDLHGQSRLLEDMLETIDAVIGAHQLSDPALCFVGNLIDHGAGSAQVARRMKELTEEFPRNVICLMGNHEQMCLEFLNAPAARHARWLRDGGAETCRSFDLDLRGHEIEPEQANALADALRDEMGTDLIDWMAARPTSFHCGNVLVSHAGADPARAVTDQTDRVLIWGHPEFLSRERVDGEWIVHGHHVVPEPQVAEGRIAINTQAWQSGVLSCAHVVPQGEVSFLQVGDATVQDRQRNENPENQP